MFNDQQKNDPEFHVRKWVIGRFRANINYLYLTLINYYKWIYYKITTRAINYNIIHRSTSLYSNISI